MQHPEVQEMFAYIRDQEVKYNPRWENAILKIGGKEVSYKEAYFLEKQLAERKFERMRVLQESSLPKNRRILFVDMVEKGLAGNENLQFIDKERLALAVCTQTGAEKLDKQEFSAQTMRRAIGFKASDRNFTTIRPLKGGIIPGDISDYAAVIFSGSEANVMGEESDLKGRPEQEIIKLNNRRRATEFCVELVKNLHEQNIPMLGICFGAQVLNHAFGENVDWINPLDHEDFESGLVKLQKTEAGKNNQILREIPDEQLYMHMNHSQEIKEPNLPSNLEVLARSDRSLVQIVERKHDHTILTVQGHPEISDSWADISLDIYNRKPKASEPFFQGYSSDVSEKIFSHFWRMVAEGR